MRTKLTMLNAMADSDFETALDRFREWGLDVVDLKDRIYGKPVAELTDAEAERAAAAMRERGLSPYCLSGELFHDDIEKGEAYFRANHLAKVGRLAELARRLRPSVVRLLAARMDRSGGEGAAGARSVHDAAPWLLPMYREAVETLHRAGFQVTIENECRSCIFASPDDILAFFAQLAMPGKAHFTYDVQNLWQMGTFPTPDVYERLRPLIGFLHLKGGQSEDGGNSLYWKSTLDTCSWPVEAILRRAIQDGVSPVVCLNPSHGKPREGVDYSRIAERDLAYARKLIHQIENEMEQE